MKILYGVQGTGNGHISRARMMARHLRSRGADVQFLFSGRDASAYFDMEDFGDYLLRRGLTFATHNGGVSYSRTLLHNRPLRFLRELRALDVSGYDVVLSDFEPVTAWAGKLAGKPVIGMGHQYAFAYPAVPRRGDNPLNRLVMRYFAPATTPVGLHWDNFGQAILPPIINPDAQRSAGDQVVIYLPFEHQPEVTRILRCFPRYRFVQYAPGLQQAECENVSLRPTSLHGFKRDLQGAQAVICNAGFELISECLYLGIPVLAKPVAGQSEQLANAAALEQLNYAAVMEDLDGKQIGRWLAALPATPPRLAFPDVAAAIVDWILAKEWDQLESLSETLWHGVKTADNPPAEVARSHVA